MNLDQVATELMELAGGDPFEGVRIASESHQRDHNCGLFHAGAPQMQLIASLARLVEPERVLDLGSGLGYSTLWLANSLDQSSSVIGIDDDHLHTSLASELAKQYGFSDRVQFVTGQAVEAVKFLEGPFDMVHDDAWFARQPDHFEAMLELLRPGGLLTMVNWFLLVDAITGDLRNDWESFAGPSWAEDTFAFAHHLSGRSDLSMTWVTTPPIAFAVKH